PIGLVGGSGLHEQTCSGVNANFAYYNDGLIGIGNSTADSLMLGIDALANIKSYVNYNDTIVNVRFTYETPSWSGKLSNPVVLLMTNYTTPCSSFPVTVSADTTICPGEPVQLYASGGTKYEWA